MLISTNPDGNNAVNEKTMSRKTIMIRILLFGLLALAWTGNLHAYIGPGAGLGVIGTAIALLAAFIFLVVGFVWYPMKKLMRRRKALNSQGKADDH